MSHTTSSTTTGRNGAIGVALAGVLTGAGGLMHPRVDTQLDFEHGLAGMFESSVWTASHTLTLAGYVVLALSLAALVRAVGRSWTPRVRAIACVAAGAAGLAAIESVPHVLAASEAAALRRGGATPLADLHSTLQVFSTPALGLSLAALAVAGWRTGALDGGRVGMAFAVLGGLVFAAAGPAIAFTENSAFSPLFAGAAGMAVWAVAAGVRTSRAVLPRAALAPMTGVAR